MSGKGKLTYFYGNREQVMPIYCAPWMAALVEVIFGMVDLLENNSTVSDILYDLVLGMYVLWHL